MNIRIIKRNERKHQKEGVTDVPKTAEQAEREVARRTITRIEAWVEELRQRRQAETVRARQLFSKTA